MRNLINKIKEVFFSRQFMIFVIIGVINTFNGTLFSMIYQLAINANLAFIIGYITSLCIAYMLNSKYIFYRKLSIVSLVKFSISYIPNFIIQNIVVLVGYNILGLASIYVYMIAAIVGIPITFLCVKLFAFGKTKDSW